MLRKDIFPAATRAFIHKLILSGSKFDTVSSTFLKYSQMFILYVRIILNNHYGSYFLWQKNRKWGHPCPMDTFLVLIYFITNFYYSFTKYTNTN